MTLDRADGYRRGDRVPVWIRRGRLSGWPYFRDLAAPEELDAERAPEELDAERAAEREGREIR